MPRGAKPGERRGGRVKGIANKKTSEIANKAAQDGITPLEVMIAVMREAWEAKQEFFKQGEIEKALQAGAIAADKAKDAAPYMHPKLQPVNSEGNSEQTINVNASPEQVADARERVRQRVLGGT